MEVGAQGMKVKMEGTDEEWRCRLEIKVRDGGGDVRWRGRKEVKDER